MLFEKTAVVAILLLFIEGGQLQVTGEIVVRLVLRVMLVAIDLKIKLGRFHKILRGWLHLELLHERLRPQPLELLQDDLFKPCCTRYGSDQDHHGPYRVKNDIVESLVPVVEDRIFRRCL